MIDKFSLAMIHDDLVRRIIQADLSELTEKAQSNLHWLQKQLDTGRLRAYETGELRRSKATDYLSKEIKTPLVRYVMRRAVWEVLCNARREDPSKGEPIPEIESLLKQKGIAPEIINSALIGAFVAVSIAWAGLKEALVSERKTKIEEDIIGFVVIQLDHAYQNDLGEFCKFVPKE